jgi:hypothetical protein
VDQQSARPGDGNRRKYQAGGMSAIALRYWMPAFAGMTVTFCVNGAKQ